MTKDRLIHLLASLRILRFYVPHLTALGAAIIAGIAMGFVTIMGRPPAVDTTDRWALPRWAPYVAGPKRDEMARASIWVEEPGKKRDEAVKVAAPPWRFIGTVRDGEKILAVIELDQGKRVQRLSQGEALPNGAQIVRVSAGEMSYSENDAEMTLKLFGVTKDENFPGANKKK